MNNFKTFEGLLPIWLGDIDFMNAAVQQTFRELLTGILGSATPNWILCGVEFKNGTYTDGIVCIGGEILPFESTAWDKSTQGIPYMTVESTVAGGRKTRSGVSVDCYEYRKAVLATEGLVRVDSMGIYSRVADLSKEYVVSAYISKQGRTRILHGTILNFEQGDAKDDQWNLLASIEMKENWDLTDMVTMAICTANGNYSIPVKLTVSYKSGGDVELSLYQWGKCTAPTLQSYTFQAVM